MAPTLKRKPDLAGKQTRTDAPITARPAVGPGLTATNPIAAYVQSLRVGKAAHARLITLLPELTKVGVLTDAVILDARRALRDLDEALDHTRELPFLADPALADQHRELQAKRDALPRAALSRFAPPPPAPTSTQLPRLTCTPSQLSFTTTYAGRSQAQSVIVRNDESIPVQIQALVASGDAFDARILGPDELDPGEATRLVVFYRPKAAGNHGASIALDTGGTAMTIAVDGVATAAPGGAHPDEMGPHTPDLAPHPAILSFAGTGHQRLEVMNASAEPVFVHSAAVVGDLAFSAHTSAGTLEPGAVLSIGVDFDHASYAGKETSVVIRSARGAIHVPVRGPRSAPFGPRFRPTLNVAPGVVEYPTVHAERLAGTDRPKVAQRPRPATISVHNRNKDPLTIASARSDAGGGAEFSVALHGRTVTVGPGARTTLEVELDPKRFGSAQETLHLIGPDGADHGSVTVRGEVLEQGSTPALPIQEAAPAGKSHDKPEAVKDARASAEHAATKWLKASTAALTRSDAVLSKDWIKYRTLTAVSPGIPLELLHGPHVVHHILGHAFGKFMVEKTPIKVLEHLAVHGAEHAAGKVLSAAGAVFMGTGAGFIVGVLLETAAVLLFNQFTEDANEAVKHAYEAGQTDGARKVGDAVVQQSDHLHRAFAKAMATANAQHGQLEGIIGRSALVADLERITRELDAVAAAVDTAKPAAGVATQDLLELWVRGRAATARSATEDTNQGLWRDAITHLANKDPAHYYSTGQLRNQPDLFVAQCAAEWSRRGLSAPEDLQRGLARELGISAEALADPKQAPALARRFAQRYSHNEFVWDQFSTSTFPDELTEILPVNPGGKRPELDLVASTPVLGVEDGCCVVKKFLYRVANRKTGAAYGFRVAPGAEKVEVVQSATRTSPGAEIEFFSPSQAEQNATLYRFMAALERAGTPIVQLDRTDGDAVLAREFGHGFATPRQRHAGGVLPQVTVFKAGTVRMSAEAAAMPIPRRGLDQLGHGMEVVVRSDLSMLRGGDAVLVIRTADLHTIGAKSTEPDPMQAQHRREIEDGWKPHPL